MPESHTSAIRCSCGRQGWQFKAGRWWCVDCTHHVVVWTVRT